MRCPRDDGLAGSADFGGLTNNPAVPDNLRDAAGDSEDRHEV